MASHVFSFSLFLSLVFLLPITSVSERNQKREGKVEVKWLGHACFYLKSSEGIRIVTDPFGGNMGERIGFPSIKERTEIVADIITVSHEHGDHNAVDDVNQVKGGAVVVRSEGKTEAKKIIFRGIGSFHDKEQGAKRGPNTIIVFTLDGITFCHLGDLGHILSDEQVKEIGRVDVLFIPVGGGPTINAEEGTVIISKLKPKIAIPMHYRHKRAEITWLDPVDGFLKSKEDVKLVKSDSIELARIELPEKLRVVVIFRIEGKKLNNKALKGSGYAFCLIDNFFRVDLFMILKISKKRDLTVLR